MKPNPHHRTPPTLTVTRILIQMGPVLTLAQTLVHLILPRIRAAAVLHLHAETELVVIVQSHLPVVAHRRRSDGGMTTARETETGRDTSRVTLLHVVVILAQTDGNLVVVLDRRLDRLHPHRDPAMPALLRGLLRHLLEEKEAERRETIMTRAVGKITEERISPGKGMIIATAGGVTARTHASGIMAVTLVAEAHIFQTVDLLFVTICSCHIYHVS